MNRKYLFILISFIALLAVLLIQVNWIVKSAELKEKLFNEKAKIVLSKASEAISEDKVKKHLKVKCLLNLASFK